MLKRIYIDNFRCFVNFEYKPERKQLLLGENGSGKSSLLDAIEAIRKFVLLDTSALGTFRNSRTRWLNRSNQIFEIEAQLDDQLHTYRLELQSEDNQLPKVVYESLEVDRFTVIEYSDGQEIRTSSGQGNPMKVWPRHMTEALALGDQSVVGHFRMPGNASLRFCEWLQESLNCHRINPSAMETIGQYNTPYPLAFDMSNLSSFYRRRAFDDKESAAQVLSSLREIMDGLFDLSFKELQGGSGRLVATFDSQGSRREIELGELSDGQKCLFALCIVLHFLIAKGHTVFLDEPDNFVSLREIQPWLLQAEAAADDSKGQLILISHHPEILNQWAHEYGMRMFREDGGPVQIEKYKTDYDDLMQPSEVVARGWEND